MRPKYVTAVTGDVAFLTLSGEQFHENTVTQLVGDYVRAAGVGKKGACHLFRHTMATLMLENGADIRYIQAILGHGHLSSTEIYTQVSIRKLKEVGATHPGAGLKGSKSTGESIPSDTDLPPEENLLAALEAENDD